MHEAPSLTPGALPAVVVPSGSKTGWSAASFSSVVSRRIPSSAITSPTATISSSKRPASCAAAARACERYAHSSCSSREMLELARDPRRLLHHVQPVEGRGEPVEDHVVDDFAVAEPVAEARLRQEVRRVRHRLHPPRDDDVVAARTDHQVGDLDGADRRRADLVDRVRRNLLRDPGRDGRLPGRRLAYARLEHLSHDDVLDLLRFEPRTLERGANRDRSQLGRLQVRKTPTETPNGVRTAETMTDRVTRISLAKRLR